MTLRVVVLGAGLGGLELSTLLSEALADRLAEAIRIAVSDTTMRKTAARLGEIIRTENGVARAVAVLEQDFKRQQSA